MSKTLVVKGTDFSANKLATVTFIESIPCTGIELDITTKAVTAMEDFTLTPTVTPANTTDDVTWVSSDNTVATVVAGVVTPLKLGTTTITATCGNHSAECAVTIDNVVVDYVAVAGYNPYKRGSAVSNHALTLDKKSDETSGLVIIAADQATGLYPIETKNGVDTSPYRFVPIIIPKGATKVIFTTSLGNIKTRSSWIDSTKKDTTYDIEGAYCVQGSTSAFDQNSTAPSPLTVTIPDDVTGLDSCCFCLAIGGWYGNSGTDYASSISVMFSYDTI